MDLYPEAVPPTLDYPSRPIWWLLERAVAVKPNMELSAEARLSLAHALQGWFGVAELLYAGYFYIEGTESEFDLEAAGEFELHTLTQPDPTESAFSIAISLALGPTTSPSPLSASNVAVLGDCRTTLRLGRGLVVPSSRYRA